MNTNKTFQKMKIILPMIVIIIVLASASVFAQEITSSNVLHIQPLVCTLTNAYWSLDADGANALANNHVLQHGASVYLVVEGTHCNGKQAAFVIKEYDVTGPDYTITPNPQPDTFTDGKAMTAWAAEWQRDIIGTAELKFTAAVEDKTLISRQLKVQEPERPVAVAGKTNGQACNNDGECTSGNCRSVTNICAHWSVNPAKICTPNPTDCAYSDYSSPNKVKWVSSGQLFYTGVGNENPSGDAYLSYRPSVGSSSGAYCDNGVPKICLSGCPNIDNCAQFGNYKCSQDSTGKKGFFAAGQAPGCQAPPASQTCSQLGGTLYDAAYTCTGGTDKAQASDAGGATGKKCYAGGSCTAPPPSPSPMTSTVHSYTTQPDLQVSQGTKTCPNPTDCVYWNECSTLGSRHRVYTNLICGSGNKWYPCDGTENLLTVSKACSTLSVSGTTYTCQFTGGTNFAWVTQSDPQCSTDVNSKCSGAQCVTVGAIVQPASCTDSDNGETLGERGTTTSAKFGPSDAPKEWTDLCLKDYQKYKDGEYAPQEGVTEAGGLLEGSCGPNLDEPGIIRAYECPNVCQDGACLPAPPQNLEYTTVNMALNKAAFSCNNGEYCYGPAAATDGAPNTRLAIIAYARRPHTLTYDLGQTEPINSVSIDSGGNTQSYEIQYSMDNQNWQTAGSGQGNQVTKIDFANEVQARYIKILVSTSTNCDNRGCQTDIYELAINKREGKPAAPPQIRNPSSSNVRMKSATIAAETDEQATCRYATSDKDYGQMDPTTETAVGTSHSWSLSGLTPDASYAYYIRCKDVNGNANMASQQITFTTLTCDPADNKYDGTVRDNECWDSEAVIFITRGKWNGYNLGGLSGADAKCQKEASGGVAGTYKAFLSDSNTNAKDRVGTDITGLTNFGRESWRHWQRQHAKLAETFPPNGTLGGTVPYSPLESSPLDSSEEVWTGSNQAGIKQAVWNGNYPSDNFCKDWNAQISGGQHLAAIGKPTQSGSIWTYGGACAGSFSSGSSNCVRNCGEEKHLLCVQVI